MFSRIVMLAFGLSNISVCFASEREIQLGIYQSDIAYTEPDVMEENGTLSGFIGRYIVYEEESFRALEFSYASGDMDYDGSGTMTGIPDEIFEVRGLIGGNIALTSDYQIMPYIGFGYRNLNDDSSDMISSTSANGYEREQIYVYFPIGLEVRRRSPMSGWSLSGRIEYDYFIDGTNHSYLGDIQGYEDLTFDQNNGYGYRASISLTKEFDAGWSITIEPFYKYWNVSESEVTYSVRHTSWVEPDNDSKEVGISLLLTL